MYTTFIVYVYVYISLVVAYFVKFSVLKWSVRPRSSEGIASKATWVWAHEVRLKSNVEVPKITYVHFCRMGFVQLASFSVA